MKSETTEAAADIAELMAAWNKIRELAATLFPHLTEEDRFQLASKEMRRALGMEKESRS